MRPRESRIVRITLISFFALASVYGLYEAQGVVYGPEIVLASHTVVSRDSFTHIEGETHRIAELRLNGRTIPVTENGAFREPYALAPGTNHFVLEARDARKRTVQESLTIFYTGTSSAPQQLPLTPQSTTTSTSTSPESAYTIHGNRIAGRL